VAAVFQRSVQPRRLTVVDPSLKASESESSGGNVVALSSVRKALPVEEFLGLGGLAEEIYLFDHELKVIGYHKASAPDESAASSRSGNSAELASIIRANFEGSGDREDGEAAEILRGDERIRVLPMQGGSRGYAVLIERCQDHDVIRAVAARYGLSAREFEVLALLVHGLTRADIALRLQIAETSVRTHLNDIGSKLGWLHEGATGAQALGID
jgi:DNA-binding CsgD family transcriptional regulator